MIAKSKFEHTLTTTEDLGRAIAELLEGAFVAEHVPYEAVHADIVDASDVNNLRVTLSNGQSYVVRIVAGG